MAKMNVSQDHFARALNQAVVDTPEGKRVCLDKLAQKSGLSRQSANVRLYSWRKRYKEAGVKFPWPPTKGEGRGGKKLNLAELAAIAAEWQDSEEGEGGED